MTVFRCGSLEQHPYRAEHIHGRGTFRRSLVPVWSQVRHHGSSLFEYETNDHIREFLLSPVSFACKRETSGSPSRRESASLAPIVDRTRTTRPGEILIRGEHIVVPTRRSIRTVIRLPQADETYTGFLCPPLPSNQAGVAKNPMGGR